MFKIIWLNKDKDEIGALGNFEFPQEARRYAAEILVKVKPDNFQNWDFPELPQYFNVEKE